MTQFYYRFLETGTLDRTLRELDQLLKCLGFSLHHISFFIYSPFKPISCLSIISKSFMILLNQKNDVYRSAVKLRYD